MKTSTLYGLALVCIAVIAIQRDNAASAVAIGSNGYLSSAARSSLEDAKQRALEICRSHGGIDVRLVASSAVAGYCAIAVGRKGNCVVYGIALGKRSATEADTVAIELCLKAGGLDPKVKYGWQG
jgi:hypothetical protein